MNQKMGEGWRKGVGGRHLEAHYRVNRVVYIPFLSTGTNGNRLVRHESTSIGYETVVPRLARESVVGELNK